MEVGSQIREMRKSLSLSQDALAERIYVSRQTISSWENGKTYPDLQSLLLLSNAFDVTVDALIKGDVETMEKKVADARKEMTKRALVTTGMFLLLMAAVTWFAWQQEAGWGEKALPTLVLVGVALAVAVASLCWLGNIWRDLDLRTYAEVLDYARGRSVRRDTALGRLARGSVGEQIVHILPYLAALCVVGELLGRLVKMALVSLGLA